MKRFYADFDNFSRIAVGNKLWCG